ncbi:MAG: hypothetical protein IRY97_09145 [Thermomicrobiaceae bacterium]|nr:hypothetical protein [Thermomicrobiaceae bacterium]
MPEPTSQVASFVVRYWRLPDGGGRFVVEHVQTGERVHLASLAVVLDWIASRIAEASAPAPPS